MTTLGFVNVDPRGRVSLAKFGAREVRIYEVQDVEDRLGELHLIPVVVE